MRYFLLLIFVKVAISQDQIELTASVDVGAPEIAADLTIVRPPIIDPRFFCLYGIVALPPVKPLICKKPDREVFACGYGEARCDNFGYCGTPPCHWRCWCRDGWKRNSARECVKRCPFVLQPFPYELASALKLEASEVKPE